MCLLTTVFISFADKKITVCHDSMVYSFSYASAKGLKKKERKCFSVSWLRKWYDLFLKLAAHLTPGLWQKFLIKREQSTPCTLIDKGSRGRMKLTSNLQNTAVSVTFVPQCTSRKNFAVRLKTWHELSGSIRRVSINAPSHLLGTQGKKP